MTFSDPSSFLDACRNIVGLDRIHSSRTHAGNDCVPRSVSGVVEVETVGEVQAVVRLANKHHVHLAPLSTGKNWGFGASMPVKNGAVLLDLHRMNKIREINRAFGFAVVEPGVTQGNLAHALRAQNLPWTLDVTGAGPDTSVVGNTLERGIAYHSQRTHTTRHFEVVLGDGTLIFTGFQDPRVKLLNHLYTPGVGPDPTGLFYQSRFGIVTALTIDLLPISDHMSVGLNLKEDRLSILIETLRSLRLEGAQEGVPHIANRARFFSTMVPLLVRQSRNSLTRVQAEKMLMNVFPEEWTLLTSVRGPKALAKVKAKMIKRCIQPLGRVWVMTPFMRFLQRWIGRIMPSVGLVMDAAASLQGLPIGIPSGDPLHFLDYDVPESCTMDDIDKHPMGFVYLVPLMPSSGETIRRFLDTLPALTEASGQKPAVTLNALDARVLEAVVSLTFNKSDPDAVQRILRVGKNWLEQLKAIGAHPYRLHIDHMDQTGPAGGPWQELQNKTASLLDPNGVISQGRYDLRNQD